MLIHTLLYRPFFALGLMLFSVALSLPLQANPVPEADRVPLDLRRTTLIVEDVDRSLALYHEVLGLTKTYDNMVRTPREAQTDAEAEISRRLVFLQANDDFIGVLGLLEYRKPRQERTFTYEPFALGSIAMVINVEDLESLWEDIAAVPGVEVLSEPFLVSYPSYDGESIINVMQSEIRDPDGFVIEINQLLTDIR